MVSISKLLVVMMFSLTLLVPPSMLSSFADHPKEESSTEEISSSELKTKENVTMNFQSQFGFTNVKKSSGIIMKFCSNEALTLQDCHEKYDGYTWTDRVHVLIYAPGWNHDEYRVEDIGESAGSPITISTREARVTSATFTETGPDTGIFFGTVKLTGQHSTVHDQNGSTINAHGHTDSNYDCISATGGGGHAHGFLIPLIMKMKGMLFTAAMMDFTPSAYAHMHHGDDDDEMTHHGDDDDEMTHHGDDDEMHDAATGPCGDDENLFTYSAIDHAARLATDFQEGAVTVSWEANDDVVITKSATWSWRMGELNFDKESFSVNEPIKFTLHDADLWIHHHTYDTYWIQAYSDSDHAGIFVPVQFIKNHGHGASVFEYEGVDQILSEPAASSLTKYTPDGEWKLYFWWNPGGVIGINQDYDLNLMVHEGLTDLHQTKLSYTMEVWFNGELIDVRSGFSGDGQAIEKVRFDERGSVKIVYKDLFDTDASQSFSFQVAPEAVLKQVVGKHHAFEEASELGLFEGRIGGHYIDVLQGEFYVTMNDRSLSENRLRVANGDTITLKYIDMTLPKPYSYHDDQEITARTVVFDQPIGLVTIDDTISDVNSSMPKQINGQTVTSEQLSRIDARTANKAIIHSVSADIQIPDWVKQNASWWVDSKINDNDFAKGIEYLVQEQIIDVPRPEPILVDGEEVDINNIPRWVRSNADWWSQGYVTDVEFANGIKYLISTGLIRV